jgi:hypothetical protein
MTARNRRRCYRMNRTKEIIDFIESSNLDDFEGFCRRMWLDYCDEHSSPHSVRYTYEDYTRKFSNYLMEKYGTSKK